MSTPRSRVPNAPPVNESRLRQCEFFPTGVWNLADKAALASQTRRRPRNTVHSFALRTEDGWHHSCGSHRRAFGH
jgi:hypothetical protein